jgi:hypothetical protein
MAPWRECVGHNPIGEFNTSDIDLSVCLLLFSESQIIAQKNLLIILALSWRSTYSMHAVTVAVAFAARGTDLLPLPLQKLVNKNHLLGILHPGRAGTEAKYRSQR